MVAVHELGHALAVILTRAGKVQGMVLNWRGIGLKWEIYCHEPLKRTIVPITGPGINLTLAAAFLRQNWNYLLSPTWSLGQ